MLPADERWVLRADDQRQLDARAEGMGIGQDVLMESAGTHAAAWILRRIRPRRVAVIAGPGGNGGDGLVVARRLHEAGIPVATLSLKATSASSPAFQRMAARLEEAGAEPVDPVGDAEVAATLRNVDCVVDALFGSGLSRSVAGPALRLIQAMNAAPGEVVSLDLPSGLGSDRGKPLGEAVRADITLAMAFLKPAHLLYPAAGCCGNTAVVEVAYPDDVSETVTAWGRVSERAGIARRLPRRRPDGHKGTFGRVVIVAGSVGMSGAAILCARGAARVGAGLIYAAIPASLDAIVETALPEAITLPMPDEDGRLVGGGGERFDETLGRADLLAIGPGLGRADDTARAVRAILSRFDGPVVLDADGFVVLAGEEALLRRLAGRTVVTPHPGELSRWVDATPAVIDRDRRDHARAFAMAHRLVVVLKGRPTAIGLPDGEVYLNPTGHDGLATGGTGDVLTGMIAGLAASGAPLADAAVAATYVHGLAADLAVRRRSPRSLIPTDLHDAVPQALWEIERCA